MLYPDLAFTLSLLVKGEHRQEACAIVGEAGLPLALSIIHRLQIENAFLRSIRTSSDEKAAIARAGLCAWRAFLDEEVFVIQHFEIESALAQAAAWNAGLPIVPPPWGLLLHPAMAATVRATFLSFDPLLRDRAAAEGLKLLPAKI